MNIRIIAFSTIVSLILLSGCTTKRTEIGRENTDPCGLLSSAEIESVQGETVSSAKGDRGQSGPFVVSQCFYTLPTYSRSVSVNVMRAEGDANAASEFWDRRFHSPDAEADEERAERSGQNGSANDREIEELKEKARPQPVSDIGDEAFWTGTQVNGSLYIRFRDEIIRISIGGPEEQAVKIEKARTLGEKIVSRL